mmetsp:Transcript_60673/g.185340  ORF Transcript_60673/g.185340 Transcript_60673/m.185340 type:complete len:544 (-) Transcript_60673:228-1859(-)|eukprot:CAMPEP_0198504706 /NCGR_PEP_ID=MMETSP1462-20131121/10632_1 /TAXON_ID=1333877 /ORGANISM="Brandtodinium nutriculum, Strain RCC3387" /LENGTH=543 /DNA_ID=CAMNT_0044233879 /DNA_START=95 /DNA_END=1726 /DNA_ORIENTATION=+
MLLLATTRGGREKEGGAAPLEDSGYQRREPCAHGSLDPGFEPGAMPFRRSSTCQLLASAGLDRELGHRELCWHQVKIVVIFLPLGLAIAGACWSSWRVLDTSPVLVAQHKLGLSLPASRALCLYLASMWTCSFATMFYFCAISPLYDDRTWPSKASAVLMRLLLSFFEIGVWVAHKQESGVRLSTMFWATVVRLFLVVPAELGYFLTLAQNVRESFAAGNVERNHDFTPEECHLDKSDEPQRARRQWLGAVLKSFTAMGACYFWGWTWLTLSLVVVPRILPNVRSRSSLLAALLSICYPPLLCSAMTKGMKLLTPMFAGRTAMNRIDLHYFGVIVATILAEFMCKQAAYSASTLPETACILLGQMVSEVLSRWVMPHVLTAKVSVQTLFHHHSCGRPVDDGRLSYCGIGSSNEECTAVGGLFDSTAESRLKRESSLEEATVVAACLAETRNCMEYIAHCGVVAAKYVDGDGIQGLDLAQAWLLAVGMEVASDMVFAFGKKWMDLTGTGRYPLPLNWKVLGFIVAFSAEATFLCMMQRHVVLAW